MTSIPGAISELEKKRMAVLASMKRRATSKSASPKIEEPHVDMDGLYEAVLDLRSLGYTFDRIVALSGVKRSFLAQCYEGWKFPVPAVTPTPIPVPAVVNRPSPVVKQRKLFSHKVYRKEEDRPEWLGKLVIDLESSEEEDEEEEEEGEDETEEEAQIQSVTIGQEKMVDTQVEPANLIDGKVQVSNVSKKRKFSSSDSSQELDLIELKEKKSKLNDVISSISKQVKQSNKLVHKIDENIVKKSANITINKNKILLLKSKILALQNEIKEEEGYIAKLNKEKEENQKLRESLAEKLIQMEDIQAKEKDLILKQRRDSELKEKMKKQETKSIEELQHSSSSSSSSQLTNRPDETSHISQSTSATSETTPSGTYDETIHKIPKAQQEHFTAYRSFGFRKNAQLSQKDDTFVCPFEMLNSKCDDPVCKFQHLTKA